MRGYYINNYEYVTEEEFVWSFTSVSNLYDYLVDCYNEHSEIEINTLKQAFLNHNRQFYYMECVRFEETYLKG